MPLRRNVGTRRLGPPRLPITPAEIHPAALHCELEHEQTVETIAYYHSALTGRAEQVEFIQSRFKKANLTECHLAKVRFTDCLIESCDLSNLQAPDGVLERVEAKDSRMTGLTMHGGLLHDVLLTSCKIDLANFRQTRFDVVEFESCGLAGADFTDADLRGARFRDCDLSGAQFNNAKMDGTRFRRCELNGIGGITSWQGAHVHPDDLPLLSYVLASSLGIKVTDDD